MIKYWGKLTPYFSQKSIADIVNELPKPQTPMADFLFPASARRQIQSPYISAEQVTAETGAIPAIHRGDPSYPVDTNEKARLLIEVEPISPSVFVSAKDINDLIALGDTESLRAFVAEKTEYLRNRVSATIETLTRQSLSGKISYPYATANGVGGTYDVELGKTNKLKPVSLKDAAIPQIQAWLEDVYTAQASTGASGDVYILLGKQVYLFVANKFVGVSNAPVVWEPDGMTLFGKYKIRSQGLTYTLPGSKTVNDVLPPDGILSLDKSNTGRLFFASLDDIDANLAALPFYAKPVESKDPDGVKIVASSKPLPAPALGKMCQQQIVLA
jgi:hypothetical protein